MSQPAAAPEPEQPKLITPVGHVVDVLLTGVFFVYMTWVAYGHTPDFSEQTKWIWAAITSSCLSGVFWLAVQCFRVTLVYQRRLNSKE